MKLVLILALLFIVTTTVYAIPPRDSGISTSPRIEFNWQGRLAPAINAEDRSNVTQSSEDSPEFTVINRLPVVGSRPSILPRMEVFPVSFSLKSIATIDPVEFQKFPVITSPRIDLSKFHSNLNTSPR